jgi:hypothetical protein
MTATLSQLTSSSLTPGCSLQTAQVEPVTSNGQYGIPSGIVFDVGLLTLDCSRALAASAPPAVPTSTVGAATAGPDTTTECPNSIIRVLCERVRWLGVHRCLLTKQLRSGSLLRQHLRVQCDWHAHNERWH